jgi:AraC-like DNA-binding protein
VALDVGYSNVGAFIDMFKKAMGVTPGRFLQGTDGV